MSTSAAPRRSASATKAAILEAARRRFAEEGYDKATIRGIAADVGIDPSMVMRYYGSKNGLFAAALDVDLELPDLADVHADAVGELLVRRFLVLWEEPPTATLLRTLMRSSLTDESTGERFRSVFTGQVMPAVAKFGDSADAPRRAGLVVTQLLGLALCRYVLRLPPVVALTPEEIVEDVGGTLQRYLVSRTGTA